MDISNASHTGTILIVDDNEYGRLSLQALLMREGYQLELAASGREALEKVAHHTPDLVLLDVMMPEMDGIEVCRLLRSNPATAEMPILMITALSDNESRLEGFEAGADDFVSRPFDSAELRARVRTIMRLNRYRRIVAEREQRQQAEQRTLQQMQRLAMLHTIGTNVTRHLDQQSVLNSLVQQAHEKLCLDAAATLLVDRASGMLVHTTSAGFTSMMIDEMQFSPWQSLLGYVAYRHTPIYVGYTAANPHTVCVISGQQMVPHVEHDMSLSHELYDLMEQEQFAACYVAPIVTHNTVWGVLILGHRSLLEPDRDWMAFLETLAGQAAAALDNARLYRTLQESYDATLEGWVGALDLHDKETEGHSRRVTALTLRLARQMGIHGEELEHIRRGALLHDIGKLGIPDSILLKPGPLTDEEWEIMRSHPVLAYEWLSRIEYLRPALDIPYYHHERWDGSGYPFGLCGTEIPLAARIFAVIDVWDALTSDRPYRERWPEERVREYLCAQTGKHFDPMVVQSFLEMIEQKCPRTALPERAERLLNTAHGAN